LEEVIGAVVVAAEEEVAVPVPDAVAGAEVTLDVAPIRCCRSSAIRIVVLSIADFGK